ncbi:MAG: DUF2752 domain-containing protein [Candidatus Poribacteria bacterium]|nr:DUF2752 domain-containing protein [Candidatus Poribacteria bacterium]MDE0504456.1 DUF2752 domain-containing protein [Candidatus Poribacteria bacterium]
MMSTPTINHVHLARAFLIGLVLVSIYTAWAGLRLGELTLIPCPFRLVTDTSCPGCGMTRACVSLAQGRFGAAWDYHPFSYLILALAVGTFFFPRKLPEAWQRIPAHIRNCLAGSTLALLLGLWICRLMDF